MRLRGFTVTAILLSLTNSGLAQDPPDTLIKDLDEVIVVGSRFKAQKSIMNTPVPIDVVNPGRQRESTVELTRVLINTIPSFNSASHGFSKSATNVPLPPGHACGFYSGY